MLNVPITKHLFPLSRCVYVVPSIDVRITQIVSWYKAAPSLFPPHHLSRWYTLDAYHCAGSRILSRSFMVSKWTSDDSAEEQSNDENEDVDSDGEPEDNIPDQANTSFGSAMDVDDLPPTDNHEDDDEDEDDPSDVAMVPMADLLNARWGSENVRGPVYDSDPVSLSHKNSLALEYC